MPARHARAWQGIGLTKCTGHGTKPRPMPACGRRGFGPPGQRKLAHHASFCEQKPQANARWAAPRTYEVPSPCNRYASGEGWTRLRKPDGPTAVPAAPTTVHITPSGGGPARQLQSPMPCQPLYLLLPVVMARPDRCTGHCTQLTQWPRPETRRCTVHCSHSPQWPRPEAQPYSSRSPCPTAVLITPSGKLRARWSNTVHNSPNG